MKKQYRVCKNYEFSAILKEKRFYACPSFVIYVRPREKEYARVGISVGKKLEMPLSAMNQAACG
ncbi:MAG: ribonuclease P protein component [Merdibacter sp.]